MTDRLSVRLLFPCALALSVISAFAQSTPMKGSWGEVRQLAANTQIRVELSGGRKVDGQFQSATDDSLSIAASSGQESLARPMVARVSFKTKNHRKRNILIGLGVGAAGGLATGAAADASCKFLCFDNLGKAVFTPVGALVGVAVGALIPTGRYHDIYRIK